MRCVFIMVTLVIVFILTVASSYAGWIIYHETELNGKILDIDTKQPIEGAVIVVEYNKATIGLGAGSITSIINFRETLTDKDGDFHIPSYSTFIQPFSWQIPSTVIIFKPSYASIQLGTRYFIGKQIQEQERSLPWSKVLKYFLRSTGIVELPRLKTREDIVKRTLEFPTGFWLKKLPLLYKAYDEEKNILRNHQEGDR